MSKRANDEGTVFKRADGRWSAALQLGYFNGKRQRRYYYGATQKEARSKLQKAQATLSQGLPIPPERLTVGQLLDQWLSDVVKPTTRDSTYRRHADIVRVHLKPTLGHVRLAKLTHEQVQSLMSAKLAARLSPRSVQYIRGVLRAALSRGMRWGYIGINVATLTDPPRVQRREVHPLSKDEARALLKALRGHALSPLFVTALATGLRQGELLGLRWKDVDLDAASVRVTSSLQKVAGEYVLLEPKTAKSRRTAILPEAAQAALREQRLRQVEQRLAIGPEWGDEWGLVFTTPFGRPWHGPTVTRQFQAALKAAGLPRTRFHDLRHGAATLYLAQGVPLRVVQEILGHATISVTADVYGHLVPELQKDAADRMDDALGWVQ
jgi:integrase